MRDQDLAFKWLREMDHRVCALRSLAPVTPERLSADRVFRAAVERNLQIATQAVIGIAAWVAADRGWREPTSHADTFSVLDDESYLDRSVASRLAKMAEYRNTLVLDYTRVSHEATARHATEGLADFAAFAERFAAG